MEVHIVDIVVNVWKDTLKKFNFWNNEKIKLILNN